jgi:thioredoxin 2
MAAPEVAMAAAKLAGKAIVHKVNTEKNSKLAGQYGVNSIPNFAQFRNGMLRRQQPGMLGHRQLERLALADA